MNKTLTCKQCGKKFVGDYRRRFCDACKLQHQRERNRKYREANPEYSRKYRETHCEERAEYRRDYYLTHIEQFREYNRKYRQRVKARRSS